MACSPEEIERKRKLALEKLQAKKQKLSSPLSSPNIPSKSPLTPKNKVNHSTSGSFNFKSNTNGNTGYNNTSSSFNFKQSTNGNTGYNNTISYSNFKQNTNGNTRYNNLSTSINKKSANLVPSTNNSPTTTGIPSQSFFGKSITGTCYMITEDRFEVNIKYHEQVIQIFRSISSANYGTASQNWNFKIEDYSLLMNKVKPLEPHVILEKIPPFVLNYLNKPKTKNDNIDLDKIEPELLKILMPFQQEGVLFAIQHQGRCLIADEMGLGKTIQALAVASYYKEDWPLLIVTTSSMKNTWEQAIHQFLPSIPLALIRYMNSAKDYISDADILIVSYDLMARAIDVLLERKFGVLIVDESHTIKNFKAKCTKSAMKLAKNMERVILLSGTPALSRPSELYSQLSLIDEKFFGNFFEYTKRYCEGQTTKFGWDASGKSNLQELEIIMKKKFMIRRTKAEVLCSLPDKTREVIKLDVGLNNLPKEERLCLKTLVDNYVENKQGNNKHMLLLQLFSESAKIKAPSVCLYIENILKKDEKFLVFAHHQVMLDAICRVLDKNRKEYIRIDGNTSSEQRKYFINKFQVNDSCIAAVLSITAANAGITLTAAKLVLFAELHWNPSILSQAESRAHRIGQQKDVEVRYLLASGTSDDHVWYILQSKQNVLNEAGLSKDSFKDTAVSNQVVCSPGQSTIAGTRDIKEFFSQKDDILQEFMNNDDDDLFVNADF